MPDGVWCPRCQSWLLAGFARTHGAQGLWPGRVAEHDAVIDAHPQCTCGREVEDWDEFRLAINYAFLGAQLEADRAIARDILDRIIQPEQWTGVRNEPGIQIHPRRKAQGDE